MGLKADISVKGPLFTQNIGSIARGVVIDEIHNKVKERTVKSGRHLGGQRNPIRFEMKVEDSDDGFEKIVLEIITSLHWPRTTGKTWTKKQMAILRSMIPRVSKKTLERLCRELNG